MEDGKSHVIVREARATEYLPATQSELGRWVADNATGPALPIYPAGGRTAWHAGPSIDKPGIVLSTTDLARIVDYPARDMTVTVEAGIRLTDLTAALAAEGLRLAVDVAQAPRATLGGALATNTSGSRRFGLGTLRDYLIGVSAVDATGRLFKSGGRVVKNVAGYDLCKLLVGSHGTLAIITQATLKLKPIPEQAPLLWAAFDHLASIEQALARLATSAARPVALDLLDPRAAVAVAVAAGLTLPAHRFVLCVGVEGTAREAGWQTETLQAELRPCGPHAIEVVADPKSAALWTALAEFQVPSDDPTSFKANLLPSRTVEFVQQAHAAGCAVQANAGNGIAYGHLPDTVTTAPGAAAVLEPLRQFVRRCQGNLVVTFCEEPWKRHLPLLGDLEPGQALMRKLKAQLDPRGLLNPQRGFA
ncbi:MAG: FAD-binding oxidoreductase [Planctomycetaceae bacterium]